MRMVRREEPGRYSVRIPRADRRALAAFLERLRPVLEGGDPTDPAVRRLYPAAYPDDERASAEFDRLVRSDLAAQRLEALATMQRTLDAARLAEDELLGWLGAANDLRLVLGTRLELTEDTTAGDFPPGDPRAAELAVYVYLSHLVQDIVEALSEG